MYVLFAFASCFGVALSQDYEPDGVIDAGVPSSAATSDGATWRWFKEDYNCREGGSGQADFQKYNRQNIQECVDFCVAQDPNVEYVALWDGTSQTGTCRCYYQCGEGDDLVFTVSGSGNPTGKRNNVYKKWQCDSMCSTHTEPWYSSTLDAGNILSRGAVPASNGKCDWINWCDGCDECHSGCRMNDNHLSLQNKRAWGNAFYKNWCAHNCADSNACDENCGTYCMDCACGGSRRLNATVQESIHV
jgi:hypothetical protein